MLQQQTQAACISSLLLSMPWWLPLVVQMNLHITGMQSPMAAKNNIRQRMQPILLNMESNEAGLLLSMLSKIGRILWQTWLFAAMADCFPEMSRFI